MWSGNVNYIIQKYNPEKRNHTMSKTKAWRYYNKLILENLGF